MNPSTPPSPSPAAAPSILRPIPSERLAEIRSWATHSEAGPTQDREDLFRQIDHLTARLAAAQVVTPRPIQRYRVTPNWLTNPENDDNGEYVRHSDHLDALAQVHTAYNLTRDLLQEANAELTALRGRLGTDRSRALDR